MDPSPVLREPDFDGSHKDAEKDVAATSASHNHVSGGNGQPENTETSRQNRIESAATATEVNMTSIDKIETAAKGDSHGSEDQEDHALGFVETIKHATHSTKRKIYLHHRHQKDLSRNFTPNNVPKHLKLFSHGSPDQNQPEDPEAQVDSDDAPSLNIWQNITIMFTTFPYWNMAFWSGWCYSIGSAMFVIDGCWAWIPAVWPNTEFQGEEKYGVPLWFFFGACLYQVGGVMAYLEAVNDGSFAGAAMKRLLEGHQDIEKELLDAKLHTFFGHLVPHHHHNDNDDDHQDDQANGLDKTESGWKSLDKSKSRDHEAVYSEARDKVERRGGVDSGTPKEGQVREYIHWKWWPTWHGLITYHIFELGYLACTIQLFGVTLYGVTSVVILPGILDGLVWWQELAAYWIPQVIASCCFLIASIMFTVMAQDKWYKPKWGACSWWIGITAQLGSVGFLLEAIFGLYSNAHDWAGIQASVQSTWGSFFYMLSGLFQWYEAINVNVGPVLAFPNNRTPVLLRRQRD